MSIVSDDNPRTLQHHETKETTRVTDPGEYQQLTTTAGYRDVTDDKPKRSGGGSSSSSSSSSGGSSSSS